MIRLLDTFQNDAGAVCFDARAGEKKEIVSYHTPILLREIVELLQPASGKIFVDGTLGGGGHSEALLAAGARVIGLDQDTEAIGFAAARLAKFGNRFHAVHANFSEAAQ